MANPSTDASSTTARNDAGTTGEDAIDPAFRALFDLFEGPLKDVSFPDVDRAALAELAAAVREGAERVAAAEAALDAVRAALEERQLALLARSQRALAYARVYAEDDEALQRSVERIILPRGIPSKPLSIARSDRRESAPANGEPAARPRGRPRKHAEPVQLFATAPADAPEVAVSGA